MSESIPSGFTPWSASSPFMQSFGELYEKTQEDGSRILAIRVGIEHSNMHRMAHGGMLATLADSALGHTVAHSAGVAVVTAQMSIEYLDAVKPGDWLEAHVALDKVGRRLIYANCRLLVDTRCVLKASGVFAVRANQAGQPQAPAR